MFVFQGLGYLTEVTSFDFFPRLIHLPENFKMILFYIAFLLLNSTPFVNTTNFLYPVFVGGTSRLFPGSALLGIMLL